MFSEIFISILSFLLISRPLPAVHAFHSAPPRPGPSPFRRPQQLFPFLPARGCKQSHVLPLPSESWRLFFFPSQRDLGRLYVLRALCVHVTSRRLTLLILPLLTRRHDLSEACRWLAGGLRRALSCKRRRRLRSAHRYTWRGAAWLALPGAANWLPPPAPTAPRPGPADRTPCQNHRTPHRDHWLLCASLFGAL